METLKRINRNLVFALQVLLLFLLLFEGRWEAPLWMQAAGRMHPLLLHLPIGLLVLMGTLPLLRREVSRESLDRFGGLVLHVAALTAVVTALAGLWLAQEEGYISELVTQHKWLGVAVSLGIYLLMLWQERKPRRWGLFYGAIVLNLGLLTAAGHLGASLTHGEDFVLAPLREAEPEPVTTDATVFAAAIRPVLEAKCFSCHNERKTKGALLMSTKAGLLAGGEHGPLWVAGDPAESQLMQRVSLPLEAKEHMPPEGKPQLTEAEVSLLQAWIQAGADLDQRLADLAPDSELGLLVTAQVGTRAPETYSFVPAEPSLIQELNTPFRTLRPVALGSPALQAEIFVRNYYERRFLTELEAVKTQLVSLNMTNLPVTDEDLAFIGQFPHLEKLILNGTEITGATLGELQACTALKSLAVSNTAVDAAGLSALAGLPGLRELFLWNTQVDSADLGSLAQRLPGVALQTGYMPDPTEQLRLSPPQLKNASSLLAEGERAILENKLPGVDIRYTLDGSEPDSLNSPRYEAPIPLAGPTLLRAQAFRPGWLSSEIADFALFPKGLSVDSVWLAHPPRDKYPGTGAPGLIDGQKGRIALTLGNFWMGFEEDPLIATLDLGPDAPPVGAVSLSYLEVIGSWVVWPDWVEVWGGNSPEEMRRLFRTVPAVPGESRPNQIRAITARLEESCACRYLKVVGMPERSLPGWHPGAGRKGHLFVDEILVYPAPQAPLSLATGP
ncbi:MAG: peptidylprolyl isomerase [Bacteroidetes bacterium]|nr:MAG: peptidylprolyl isomerase [Bacteroidota bacterium]